MALYLHEVMPDGGLLARERRVAASGAAPESIAQVVSRFIERRRPISPAL